MKSRDFLQSLEKFACERHETFWLASRFVPKAARLRALCLLCLDGEFYRIQSQTNEPAIALVRLQWWRDEIENVLKGEETQQTLAAKALASVLAANAEDADHVLALLNGYDDIVSGAPSIHAVVLFKALFGADIDNELADLAGRTFQSAHQKKLDVTALGQLVSRLKADPIEAAHWPWLCVLGFVPAWHEKAQLSALNKRWRIWLTFLSGETALAKRLDMIKTEA